MSLDVRPRPTGLDTTTRVWVPGLNKHVFFQHRYKMRLGARLKRFRGVLPAPTLPVNWAKSFDFPMDGNDRYGDCMYAAGCHADNTWTANNGAESQFDVEAIIQHYLDLAGGDNGLDEGTLVEGWKKGLAGNAQANIIDVLDIDPLDTQTMQACIDIFGGVIFMLSVPDAWINAFSSSGGALWDAPAKADPANGHGVLLNGVDEAGRYRLQTWGSYVWLTQRGVKVCEPSAFVPLSLRWFNAVGVAPGGRTYDQVSSLWVQAGGQQPPPNPFPGPNPTPGPQPPNPTPPAPPYPPVPPPGPTPPNPPTPTPPPNPPVPSGGVVIVDISDKVVVMPRGWTSLKREASD